MTNYYRDKGYKLDQAYVDNDVSIDEAWEEIETSQTIEIPLDEAEKHLGIPIMCFSVEDNIAVIPAG